MLFSVSCVIPALLNYHYLPKDYYEAFFFWFIFLNFVGEMWEVRRGEPERNLCDLE